MSIGVAALIGCVAMAACLAIFRRSGVVTIAFLVALAAAVTAAAGESTAAASSVLAIAGLSAFWVGLLIVRLVLTRSVSLAMLVAIMRGGAVNVDELMAGRLDEALTYRLASSRNDRLELSAAGRLLVRSVAVADRVLARRR